MVVDKHLVGIFTERDVLYRMVAEGRDPETTLLEQVMTRDPQTIGLDKPLGHALHMMYDGNFRHMPVVENGIPLGIISVRDVLSPEMAEFESDLKSRVVIAEILG
jgi:CBS domain-containing protein